MHRVSAQGTDERMINVHYYYIIIIKVAFTRILSWLWDLFKFWIGVILRHNFLGWFYNQDIESLGWS